MTTCTRHFVLSVRPAILAACCAMLLAVICAAPARLCAASATDGGTDSAAKADNDQWVDRGAQSLAEGGQRKWYDPATGDVVPPKLREPRTSQGSGLEWLFPLLQLLGWAAIALVVSGLAWALIYAFLNRETTRAVNRHEAASGPSTADRVEALPFALARSDDDLLGAARRHFDAGNYSEAIIYLFSHELVELDRSECIRLTKGKTNRQYLRELSSRADLRSVVAATMDRFEAVFFGAHVLDRAGFEACWQELPRFERLLAGSAS